MKKDFFTWLDTAKPNEKELAVKKHDSRISMYRPIDRLEQRMSEKERYEKRGISEKELLSAMKFNLKNYRSGGMLYAERLAKALTPNPNWYKV